MAPETLLVATRSRDKLEEIRAILASAGMKPERITSLAEMDVPVSPAEDEIEAHATFLENAIAKARYFCELTGVRTLADDSGIVVDALGGAPGVRTKRFALDNGLAPREGDVDQANNDLLRERLRDVPDERRSAHYVCAVALCSTGHCITAIGTCSGRIAREEKGSGGFGYDPLFYIPELGITFAELSADEKNRRSHRALAVRALAPHLK